MGASGNLHTFDEYYLPYRANPQRGTDNFYTSNPGGESISAYTYVASNVWKLFMSATVPGIPPGESVANVYRYYNGGAVSNHFYKTNSNTPSGYVMEGIIGVAFTQPGPYREPVYRFYRGAPYYNHRYSTSSTTPAGFVYEGIAWYSPIPVYGCKDPTASNYNPWANQPSSGCTYFVYGCTDSNAVNYDPNANVNSGCQYANPNPTLRINNTTVTSYSIVEGDSITVSWSASDTQYMYTGSITGQGAPGTLPSTSWANGSFVAQPTSDTTYTYSVSYQPPTKYDSYSISVDVKEIPEITVQFIGNPTNTITLGQSATLDWTVSGDATSLSISPDYGSQNISGQITVSPTETTTYTLYASTPGYGGRLQDSETITLTVIQPPSASLTVPSTINWGDSSYEVQFEFENVTSYDLTVEYTDLDGAVVTHPAFTAASPSQTTVNLLIADETASTLPRWNTRGYSNGKVKLKAYGNNGLFVEKESPFNINIDQMPDAIDIPSSDDKIFGEEPVITPDATVTSEQIVVEDVDIPVEITADSPIQVEIDSGGVWYNIREIT